jgi:hypothetical protein
LGFDFLSYRFPSRFLCCISLLLHIVGGIGKWGGRFGTVSHSEWSSGRAAAPANLISAHCWLVHVEGYFPFLLRVSLTPLLVTY